MVIIIGAGPIGIATGVELKKKGIPHQIIERWCLVNSIYNYPTNMTFFSTSERLEIGGVPFISHDHKPTRKEALEYYRRVTESYDLSVNLYEEVQDVTGRDGNFTVQTDRDTYEADKIVIATGFYGQAKMMGVPGEDLPKVKHYYDEPHPYAFQDILIVGGGNSGVDAALETYRCSANVTMALRKEKLDDSVKYWVKPDIENRIEEGSITAYFNTEVKQIKEREVVLDTPEGEKTISNDFVLAMTGYQPNFGLLDQLGVRYRAEEECIPVFDDDSLETNREGIYVAGVICGGKDTSRPFIENTRVHAKQIADNIEAKLARQPV
jgi:thioredoxin reductase (NADPH)